MLFVRRQPVPQCPPAVSPAASRTTPQCHRGHNVAHNAARRFARQASHGVVVVARSRLRHVTCRACHHISQRRRSSRSPREKKPYEAPPGSNSGMPRLAMPKARMALVYAAYVAARHAAVRLIYQLRYVVEVAFSSCFVPPPANNTNHYRPTAIAVLSGRRPAATTTRRPAQVLPPIAPRINEQYAKKEGGRQQRLMTPLRGAVCCRAVGTRGRVGLRRRYRVDGYGGPGSGEGVEYW